jgi:drug/metabolite transporter superfamily protein YnfA
VLSTALAARSHRSTALPVSARVAGSLAWGMLVDQFRPDRYDIVGAAICLVGVTVIMYAPRAADGS